MHIQWHCGVRNGYLIDPIPWCIVMVHLRGVIFHHHTTEIYSLSEAKMMDDGDGGRKSQYK